MSGVDDIGSNCPADEDRGTQGLYAATTFVIAVEIVKIMTNLMYGVAEIIMKIKVT